MLQNHYELDGKKETMNWMKVAYRESHLEKAIEEGEK